MFGEVAAEALFRPITKRLSAHTQVALPPPIEVEQQFPPPPIEEEEGEFPPPPPPIEAEEEEFPPLLSPLEAEEVPWVGEVPGERVETTGAELPQTDDPFESFTRYETQGDLLRAAQEAVTKMRNCVLTLPFFGLF